MRRLGDHGSGDSDPGADTGSDADGEPDAPAPLVTLAGHAPDDADDTAETTSAAANGDDGTNQGLSVAGLATGLLGIAVGGTALARTRRQT